MAGELAPEDLAVVTEQLGRLPRALRRVAHRCPCGLPDVVETAPRLPGGTPFPTLYYLTCPRAAAAMSRLESAGLMREMTARLAADPGLRAAQAAAHQDYLTRRTDGAAAAGVEPLPPGTQSAGGMPDRVKCLHALAAHELAVPAGNPLGREALRAAGEWWRGGPCVTADPASLTGTRRDAGPGTAPGHDRLTGHGVPRPDEGREMNEHAGQASPEPVPGPVNGAVGGPLRVPGDDGQPPGPGGTDPHGTDPHGPDRGGPDPGGLDPHGGPVARVAAIDCGTNSLRLLIADVDPAHRTLTDVLRRMEIVRLGQGVDSTGRLAPAALERTFGVLREYAEAIGAAAASVVRMVATSATRDAANAADFVAGVKEIIGADPDVLRGDQEAQLSFLGATAEIAVGQAGQPAAAPPFLVTDIGGGSTEFVTGDGPDRPVAAVSMNIGCVRMTERHLRDDPPSPAQVAAATADIDAALAEAARRVPVLAARTLIGLAGSVTTVAGIALGLAHYDPDRIHHSVIRATDVHAVTAQLLGQTHAERARIGVMHPGRVDVIGGGALVLDRIMTVFGFDEILVSEHDILDGIAWSLASGRWPE